VPTLAHDDDAVNLPFPNEWFTQCWVSFGGFCCCIPFCTKREPLLQFLFIDLTKSMYKTLWWPMKDASAHLHSALAH
jgi:hypothetical protein